MAGYVIAQIKVNEPEAYEEYKRVVGPTIEKYGGTHIVRGGEMEVHEGECPCPRIAVLEFPSAQAAREWYDSPEYEGPKSIRMATVDTNLMIVEGV